MRTYAVQLIQWWYWWTQFTLLQIIRGIGYLWYPLYVKCLILLDVNFKVRNSRKYRKIKRNYRKSVTNIILSLAGKLCVFTEAFNIDAESMAFLDTPLPKYNNLFYTWLQHKWSSLRINIGYFPPCDGFPMKICMFGFAIASIVFSVGLGIQRIYKAKKMQHKVKKKPYSRVFQTISNASAFMKSEIFDGDSDTIIVDNSANCIIWKCKRNFVPSSYRKLNTSTRPNIETASGNGLPVGVGDLNIGWHDDEGKYHSFVLKNVFHIPSSPVNVLGLSAFSKSISDYQNKGTRIDSSGQESVFSWNNQKYSRSFSHSEANMPELAVNDGYAKYHTFCNFVESIQPVTKQCYQVNVKNLIKNPINDIPYKIGEQIVYKNCDHVEKGIIEAIKCDKTSNAPLLEIKFKDGRKVDSAIDTIMATDENDVGQLPYSTNEFINHAKCLTADELNLIKNPLPLNKLEREWKVLHDKFGHIPFSDMDKLVDNDVFPSRFKPLKGKPILCPSCMFGRMKRRAW